MNEHDDLAGGQSVSSRGILVKDLLHELHFEKVIAPAKCAKLRKPALAGSLRHSSGVRAVEGAAGFGKLGILRLTVAVRHHPARALDQNLVKLFLVDLDESGTARAAGNIPKDLVDQIAQPGADFGNLETCAHQPHPAVDVETHAARRYHALFHVHGRHAADWKAVALMDIRHSQTRAHDSRQGCHVHGLFERKVATNLLYQRFAGIHENMGAHSAPLIPLNAVAKRADGLD